MLDTDSGETGDFIIAHRFVWSKRLSQQRPALIGGLFVPPIQNEIQPTPSLATERSPDEAESRTASIAVWLRMIKRQMMEQGSP